jgi:hypothetical protein
LAKGRDRGKKFIFREAKLSRSEWLQVGREMGYLTKYANMDSNTSKFPTINIGGDKGIKISESDWLKIGRIFKS